MRKNCARKWLHLVIDLLPVLILPIFAIWEINHKENESISVEVANKQVVVDNQLFNTDYSGALNTYSFTFSNGITDYVKVGNDISLTIGNKVYLHVYSTDSNARFSQQGDMPYLAQSAGQNDTKRIIDVSSGYMRFYMRSTVVFSDYQDVSVNVIDLTKYFGAGNEPTLTDIDTYFPTFSAYNVGTKRLITNGTIVYDNTDIGSQMLYAVYKPVQQYFNFDNIFNFGALRNWFELNFFNGNMGIPMTIIWNIIIYEFLSDIIMLIYAFFMFIIDFANDLLEKPFSDIKRG